MTERLGFADPHKGQDLQFAVVPVADIEVISHQRKPSKPHVKSVAGSIEKIGFLTPLIAVERDGRFVVIDGQHRFLAGKELGLKEFPVVVVPEETATRMMNLNVERNLNIRERAYVSLQIYRHFLEEQPNLTESDPVLADAVEHGHNVTLGLGYEENGRLSGSAVEPILKRCDLWLDDPLTTAYETRQQRAASVVEANRLVRSIADTLKEMGIDTSYVTAQVVSYVNPLKRARGAKPFDETFEKVLSKLRELDEDPEKARRIAGG